MIAAAAALLGVFPALQSPDPTPVPFGVGETLEYTGKLGPIKLGTARLHVAGIDSIRGVPAWHIVFTMDVSTVAYRSKDSLESWFGTSDLVSRRFRKRYRNSKEDREERYEIVADSGYFVQAGKEPKPTPADAIDDGGFFYLLRTLPLEVGKTYSYTRYFRQDKNPVTLTVIGRESCELPGDVKTQCLMIHPQMEAKGLFHKKANARIWVTDDERRVPVQIRSKFPFGTGTLRLDKMKLAPVSTSAGTSG